MREVVISWIATAILIGCLCQAAWGFFWYGAIAAAVVIYLFGMVTLGVRRLVR